MTDRNMIWDPLRKKHVALTPEEKVRQWCIGILNSGMKIPLHMMMSEVGFKLGDKQMRADIVVYDRAACPLMVVECKRPEVELTRDVLDQTIGYNMVLNVRYILITNGHRTCMCARQGERFVFLDSFPEYNQMLEQ